MMNELRNGINTRLESKNVYQDKTNYLATRNYEEQTIIKPINQDNYVNFDYYNKSFNKSVEDNFSDDYKNYSINKEPIKVNNNEITNAEKDIIYSKNLNPKLETKIPPNIKNNYNDMVNSRQEINNLSKNGKKKCEAPNVKEKKVRFSEERIIEKNMSTNISSNMHSKKDNESNIQSDMYISSNNGSKTGDCSILYSGKEKYIKNPKMNSEDINEIYQETRENKYNTEKNMEDINNQNKEKLINILLTVLEKRNIFVRIKDIETFIHRYNLSYSNPDPNLLIQMITDFKQISVKNKNLKTEKYEENNMPIPQNGNNRNSKAKKDIDMFIKNEVKYNEFLISIDSRDRNISKFNNPNEFKIDFTPDNLQTESFNGYILTKFENVISVQLISAIFPKIILDGNSIEDYPYIILEIDELGSSYKSTNNNSSKAFAQLTFDIDMGKFKKLVARTDSEYKKNFNVGISLDSFTLRIKTPNGELYNFGPNKNNPEKMKDIKIDENNIIDEINNLSYDPNNLNFYKNTNEIENMHIKNDKNLDLHTDNDDNYFPINFVFKITTEQKNLDNIFIKNIE